MIRGAVHGKWEFTLPTGRSYPVQHASLTVEYSAGTVEFVYRSVESQEVGRMGHYEDESFIMAKTTWEGFFSDRDDLMRALIYFIPRIDDSTSMDHPIRYHAISKRDLPDDELKEILSGCFL